MFDPQLDELMCEMLKLAFDPLDMPAGKSVAGGPAVGSPTVTVRSWNLQPPFFWPFFPSST
jgi:hypothetical protein